MIQQLLVLMMLGICSFEDIKTKRIHTAWLACFAALGVLCSVFFWNRSIIQIMTAMLPGFLILIFSAAAHGGIGAGDGLLLLVIGFFMDVSFIFNILVLAVFLSGGCALFLYLVKKKNRKYEMPFIPFLFLAFTGEILIERYF